MMKIGFSKTDLKEALVPIMPVREPIEAICMYLEMGDERSIWAVLDFMDFNRLVTDSIREKISCKTAVPCERIHILTTHNHGGGSPNIEILSDLAADGAYAALLGAKEARMRFAFTSVDKQVSILRRLYIPQTEGVSTLYFGASEKNGFDSSLFKNNVIEALKQGRTTNYIGESAGSTPDPFPHGDDELVVVEFATPSGEPIGSVVRFAAHAVCANRHGSYSSDYPYYVRRKMSEELGGIAMFLNGPCGEIAPAMQDKYEGREATLGEYLAMVALSAIEGKAFTEIDIFKDEKREIRLPVRREILDNCVAVPDSKAKSLPEMRRLIEVEKLLKIMDFLREKYTAGEAELGDTISVFVGALRLGDLAIVAFPGEAFYNTGKTIKERFDGKNICTVTEHERTVMYLPPREEIMLGGYESVCRVTAPNAEEALREGVISLLSSFLDE